MYVFPGQFVFLTDQYYSDFGDKNISLGHNPSGSNEKSGRPCFFAFPDPSDPKISWVVPVSSQYQKYEARGCGQNLGPYGYPADKFGVRIPLDFLYSRGLIPPRESLIRFSQYQCRY